jgi:hypothetical protein
MCSETDPRDMDMDDICGGADQGEWGDTGAEEDWQYDAWKERQANELADAIIDIARSVI